MTSGSPRHGALGTVLLGAILPSCLQAQTCQPAWQSPVGASGPSGTVRALARFVEPSGPAIFVGGEFTSAGPVTTRGIARLTGSTWSIVGNQFIHGVDGSVYAMTVWDDGAGEDLYVGGLFETAGGMIMHNIARWNGTSWSPLGNGIPGQQPWPGTVFALAAYDDGTGSALFVAGEFEPGLGAPGLCITRWTGTGWAPLPGGLVGTNYGTSLAVYADGPTPSLFIGSELNNSPTPTTFTRWNGLALTHPAGVLPIGVYALGVYNDGTGAALYAGGKRYNYPGSQASLVRYTGSGWTWVPGNFFNAASEAEVRALEAFDDGTGSRLYAAGSLSGHSNIRRWNGAAWSNVGAGTNGPVYDLLPVTEDGRPTLYAGGSFTIAGGQPAARIAKWVGCATCYADCDASGVLNVNDFVCFQTRFALGEPYADCDGNGVRNVNDYICFQTKFALGC